MDRSKSYGLPDCYQFGIYLASIPDIKRKLQKTEGVLSMSSSQLIEIADKVFQNRDTEKEKKY